MKKKQKMNIDDLDFAINELHERSIDKYEFRDKIKNKNQKDVVNRLYTSRFMYPAVMTIRNTTGYPYSNVSNILHNSEVYTQFKTPTRRKDHRTITSEYVDEIRTADLVI